MQGNAAGPTTDDIIDRFAAAAARRLDFIL